MKTRTSTFLKAALLAFSLEAGAVGLANSADAFTLIERPWEINFASVHIIPEIQTPWVNVVNIGDQPVEIEVILNDYDAETGSPGEQSSGRLRLEPGQARRQDFHFKGEERTFNFTRHIRAVVYTAAEDGQTVPEIVTSFEIVDNTTGRSSAVLLPAIQRVSSLR